MIDRKELLIAGGVTVGAAVLVLFMRKPAADTTSSSNDIPGGFSSAPTVYLPSDPGTGGYTPAPPPIGDFPQPPIHYPPSPVPVPPVIKSHGPGKVNPPTKQTGKTGKAPAPHAPAPKAHTTAPKEIGTMHYATPKGGWNPSSIVDYVKEHGGDGSLAGRAKLAAAYGIKGYKGTAAQNKSLLAKLKAKYGPK